MEDRKRVWFSFLPLDYLGVEEYLNQYAAQGWALSESSDCRTFSVTLERSHRTDLRYLVSCSSMARDKVSLREKVNQMQLLGWQPVATINHFDIYASMPCRHAVVSQEKPSHKLFLWSIGSLAVFLVLSLFLLLLAYFRGIPLFDTWYLSNSGIFLHLFGSICGAIEIYYFLWIGFRLLFREQVRAPWRGLLILRGTFPVLAAAWMLCFIATVVIDLVPSSVCCLLLLLLLFGGSAFCYVRFREKGAEKRFSAFSMTLALVLALSLVFNQMLPGESRAQLGECSWRNALSAVVRGEEIGFSTTPVEAVSYEKAGSLFVVRTDYWEQRGDISISSVVYQCRGNAFYHIVQEALLQSRNWRPVDSAYDGCWSNEQGGEYTLLLCTGHTLLLLSGDQELLPHLGEFSLRLEER